MMKSFKSSVRVLFALIFFLNCNHSYSQSFEEYPFAIETFSSEFLCKGSEGVIYTLSFEKDLRRVVVNWENGFFAIGQLREVDRNGTKKIFPFGMWYLYDRQNRIRREMKYAGDCLVFLKEYNKKGELMENDFNGITTPCF